MCVCVFVWDRECMNACLAPSLTQIREETSLESNNKNLIKPIKLSGAIQAEEHVAKATNHRSVQISV